MTPTVTPLPVARARALILEHSRQLPAESVAVSAAVLGRVLAEDVPSDIDSPPFDKSLVDGYAVRTIDLTAPGVLLEVIEEVIAGAVPTKPLLAGQATRIMTGAPIPPGTDAVVMIERTRLVQDRVEINARAAPGDNLLTRGREMRTGEIVLATGTPLTPQALGVLATLGRTTAQLVAQPRVAILPTGDELVEPDCLPAPGQIRNSNARMLLAQATAAGAQVRYLGIARDTIESLRSLIREGLQTANVLILSGGVSAGKLDLVPGVLREEGVTACFHKVHLRPGKPLFFGTRDHQGERHYVFGLPGNPVSSFVCFELFIRPALRRLAGRTDVDLPQGRARLTADFAHSSDRPTYHPAQWQDAEVTLLPWFGSADLRAFLSANALAVLPPGERTFAAGETLDVLRLPE